MGKGTEIPWCDDTFNPWVGCTKVSPGCANCYAESLRKRFGKDEWGPGKQRTRTIAANWAQPIKWDREAVKSGVRRRVFCASLADWLDPEVPIEWLATLLALISGTPHLDWLLLTKRPELWRERMSQVSTRTPIGYLGAFEAAEWLAGTPPANVWVGTTVEDQKRADERIPLLLSIPAEVRFLSMEPLLEAVQIDRWLRPRWDCLCGAGPADGQEAYDRNEMPRCPGCGRVLGGMPVQMLHWIITGGESGHNARAFHLDWARSLVKQCADANVACCTKQLGRRPIHERPGVGTVSWPVSDSHGANMDEWPEDLRVREFPSC